MRFLPKLLAFLVGGVIVAGCTNDDHYLTDETSSGAHGAVSDLGGGTSRDTADGGTGEPSGTAGWGAAGASSAGQGGGGGAGGTGEGGTAGSDVAGSGGVSTVGSGGDAGGGGTGGAEATGDAGAAGMGAASCATALTRRPSGTAPCGIDAERRCLQVQQEPEREVEWYIGLDGSYPEAQLVEHCDCLVEYLEARGAETGGCGRSADWMSVIGSYAEVSPALEFEIIEEYEVYCAEDSCEYCMDLSVDDCGQDAFCSILTGARFDATLGCAWHGEPAGCSSHLSCGDAMSYALDPSGNCWEFSSTCQPGGFTDHTWEEPAQGVSCVEVFSSDPPACE
jgi:hypothetical protein